jgi:hypothetical protein
MRKVCVAKVGLGLCQKKAQGQKEMKGGAWASMEGGKLAGIGKGGEGLYTREAEGDTGWKTRSKPNTEQADF